MPIVTIDLLAGRTAEQKERLAKALTRQFVEVLGSKPSDVTVLFRDLPQSDWFVGEDATTPESGA
ncbi:4-oxalocrotonate tautomerase family protein [Pseudomonas sp. MOB-449]|nr:4-oxalocrotonate tautomerase family protein [Pseudomonas sp. MOB-449]